MVSGAVEATRIPSSHAKVPSVHSNSVFGDSVSATGCAMIDAFALNKDVIKEERLEIAQTPARARAKRIQTVGI